ncbi:hypothetical protein SFA35_04045 [Pseudomonas sp. HR96]|uniref:hypothetical protein n=1 Tax=Pseudomonas sp. HR96 TaxID=1027966 RepID=UPI002A75DB24|nr:hypothetical protein [Pseudomonas sp. HR96]WPP00562.1 hypothetical protein SFA35_04045 [Pseudomonas sp. HR96]
MLTLVGAYNLSSKLIDAPLGSSREGIDIAYSRDRQSFVTVDFKAKIHQEFLGDVGRRWISAY